MTSTPVRTVLDADEWRTAEAAHQALVDGLLTGHRQRSENGVPHPVEDFLFTYYRLRPSQLSQWHPGAGVGLQNAPHLACRRFYRTEAGVTSVDVDDFVAERAQTVQLMTELLPATAGATPQFGCFGLHEWAMVHGEDAGRRHAQQPLRLGGATDSVVEQHQLRCTHFDAFRFFTDTARPLNQTQPTVWTRAALEQPGCLHANMDLYKWAYKLLPVVSSALVVRCFVLARDIREIDMRASPYDLAELGYPAIPIETAAGKAVYVAAQREFASRSAVLRAELIEALPTLSRTPNHPIG